MLVSTKRLELRPFRVTDHANWRLAHELGNARTGKFDPARPSEQELSREGFRQKVQQWRKLALEDKVWVWGVFLKKDGRAVGMVNISTIRRHRYEMANIGYMIFPQYRGRGFAPEALRAVVELGFKQLGFHRLEAAIDLDNRSSIRTARKAGMDREGIKKHYWFQNGGWEDQVVYIAVPELFLHR